MTNAAALVYAEFVRTPERSFRVAAPHDPSIVAEFKYNDDAWQVVDLLRPNLPQSKATLRFSLIASWLQADAKAFIAMRWLQERASLSDVRRAFYCLRHLGEALKDNPPAGGAVGLRRRHAPRVIEYLESAKLSGSYGADLQTTLNAFAAWLTEEHPEAEAELDFEVQVPKRLRTPGVKAWGQSEENYLPREVLQKLLDACAEDELIYQERARKRAIKGYAAPRKAPIDTVLWRRALYAQATKLAICVGRRSIALSQVPEHPETREGEFGDQQWGVWIGFYDSKLRNDEDPVICIGEYGEIALDAIQKAQELTKPIREKYPDAPACKYLFVLPEAGGPKQLQNQSLNDYLWTRRNTGLTQRAQILEADGSPRVITTHDFRTTTLSNIILGGAPLHVARQAGAHTSADMTSRHYAVHGDRAQRAKLDLELRSGALAGLLVDAPRTVLDERIGKRQAAYWTARKRVLTPVLLGYCALPVSEGPCPTSEDCVLGDPGTDSSCVYHVYSADAIPAIQEALEVAEFNVEYAARANLPAWAENQELIASRYREALKICQKLKRRRDRGVSFDTQFKNGLPILNLPQGR
ncbi:MAG TPA: hypothetical protein VGC13_09035 [Longimicrobium sp.]|jgi:hypothetical protein|uniref:hypothetical protein n=1 Tax=Longimicrobium sp. TaxID=2029185 RepID=UPI002EDB7FC5